MLYPIKFLRRRFSKRSDAEHIQVLIRFAIVATAMVYFHSDYFADNASNESYVRLTRWTVSIAFAVTCALLIAAVVDTGVSVIRRGMGIVHDVTGISSAMFFGEGGAAAVAVIYLWVTLGNGFRYGMAYLYACAILSILGFGSVFLFSDYWREQQMLSINILLLLVMIPPYVGRLLQSLQETKAQLEQRARFDGLTGLMNRVEFEQKLDAILAAEKDGHFLLFCDLDHFKAVNDNAGHAAGDKLLIDIARIIREQIDHNDLTSRLGGDEYAVLLRDCSHEQARVTAESIRNTISGYRLAWGTDYYRVGVSVGVAPSSAVGDRSSLFRLADAACYAAKNAGRNQIHLIDARACIEDTQSIRSTQPETDSNDEPDAATGDSIRGFQRRKYRDKR